MTKVNKIGRYSLGTAAAAAALAFGLSGGLTATAAAQPAGAVAPTTDLTLSQGTGRLIQLNGQAVDVFVARAEVADVQVRSGNQIYIFGKAAGQTTIYATDRNGRVLYSASVRVGTNLGSVSELLSLAMPEADIRATPMNGVVLLTGTVRAPADVEEAQRLVQAFVGEGTQVISRLRTATPLQVMLQVRVSEVNRTVSQNIGVNLIGRDAGGGGFLFGIGQGDAGTITTDPNTGGTTYTFNHGEPGTTTLAGAGRLLGVDILGTLDLAEQSGLSTTLAEPTLTALSGETASFLAGGEFPIPTAEGINGTAIEFKQFGVSLAFSPTVLENGRISMRVRPEVSELSTENGIRLNGFDVPSLVTRRAETTVELGSGQSFVIGGLLRNSGANTVDRAPFLGSLPILGALFRSNGFRRNETELVIVVTPYLVRPVNASDVSLPTDGFRNNGTAQRVIADQQHQSRNEARPQPRVAAPATVTPAAAHAASAAPAQSSAAPGFNF